MKGPQGTDAHQGRSAASAEQSAPPREARGTPASLPASEATTTSPEGPLPERHHGLAGSEVCTHIPSVRQLSLGAQATSGKGAAACPSLHALGIWHPPLTAARIPN